MKRTPHKFGEHLLQLSEGVTIETAIPEWEEVTRMKKEDKSGVCICQHRIQHIVYMFNTKTGYTISVGMGCLQKFKLHAPKMEKSVFQTKLVGFLQRGEYAIIENLIQYSKEVEKEMVDHFVDAIEIGNSVWSLESLLTEIQSLIEKYHLEYLSFVLELVTEKIKHVAEQNEKQERERLESLRLEREKQDKEELDRERKREEERVASKKRSQAIEDYSRQTKNRQKGLQEISKFFSIPPNPCECGVREVCRCSDPCYMLLKINNHLCCINCNKWKCRCVKTTS